MSQEAIRTPAVPPRDAATVSAAPARSWRRLVVAALALTIALSAFLYWMHSRRFEDTDDAQIDGNITNVSPRITGNVTAVFVVENQFVKAGDVLAELDPTDFLIALAQAKAQVSQAQAQLDAEDPTVQITVTSNESAVASGRSDLAAAQAALSAAHKDVEQLTAQLAQAKANDRTAQLEKERSQKLLAQGAVAQSDFDERNNVAAASAANVDALEGSLAAAKDRARQQQAQIVAIQSHLTETVSNAPRQVTARRAAVNSRQAALDLAKAQQAQAEANLSYTRITAPVAGIIAKKAIAVGDHASPGQAVIAISQSDSLWVTANYRETQLERIQPGMPAAVHVDALGLTLQGSVESIGGATGSRLSVLPPENATGNYVKVVQRIPVRIKLAPGQAGLDRLRIGMSVEPKVTVP